MAYASWSVAFGEQPSAAKWNILGTNDASFNDGTGIANGVITSEHLNATIACRVYRAGALNITSSGVKITFETENYDLGSNFSTVTSSFTAPLTGYYQVNLMVAISNLDAGGSIMAQIYVNGAEYSRGRAYTAAATDDPHAFAADCVPVTAGQTIEGYGLSTTTEALQVGSVSTYMSIFFVGA